MIFLFFTLAITNVKIEALLISPTGSVLSLIRNLFLSVFLLFSKGSVLSLILNLLLSLFVLFTIIGFFREII